MIPAILGTLLIGVLSIDDVLFGEVYTPLFWAFAGVFAVAIVIMIVLVIDDFRVRARWERQKRSGELVQVRSVPPGWDDSGVPWGDGGDGIWIRKSELPEAAGDRPPSPPASA
jgi:hypothetical protein